MKLTRKDLAQLFVVIAIAMLVSHLIGRNRTIGQNVRSNENAISVRLDASSPTSTNSQADLSVIVFSDFQCPPCRASHPSLMRAVKKDGKVRIVYKDWPIFGAISQRAAKIALASDYQRIYPEVHDYLMTNPAAGNADFKRAIKSAGGNWGRLQDDLANHEAEIESQLEQNRLQAFKLSLDGTPGYLIGPILVRGALDEKEFTRVFANAREVDQNQM